MAASADQDDRVEDPSQAVILARPRVPALSVADVIAAILEWRNDPETHHDDRLGR